MMRSKHNQTLFELKIDHFCLHDYQNIFSTKVLKSTRLKVLACKILWIRLLCASPWRLKELVFHVFLGSKNQLSIKEIDQISSNFQESSLQYFGTKSWLGIISLYILPAWSIKMNTDLPLQRGADKRVINSHFICLLNFHSNFEVSFNKIFFIK